MAQALARDIDAFRAGFSGTVITPPDPDYESARSVWNGAINGFSAGKAYKVTQFKPDVVLQWETDENTPFFFNDSSSYPDEGNSPRHGKGATIGISRPSAESSTKLD